MQPLPGSAKRGVQWSHSWYYVVCWTREHLHEHNEHRASLKESAGKASSDDLVSRVHNSSSELEIITMSSARRSITALTRPAVGLEDAKRKQSVITVLHDEGSNEVGIEIFTRHKMPAEISSFKFNGERFIDDMYLHASSTSRDEARESTNAVASQQWMEAFNQSASAQSVHRTEVHLVHKPLRGLQLMKEEEERRETREEGREKREAPVDSFVFEGERWKGRTHRTGYAALDRENLSRFLEDHWLAMALRTQSVQW